MANYKTPDVYVEEISVFPPSVAEVETAIPAFIGYTQIAQKVNAGDLVNVPTEVYSLKDYEHYFGFPNPDNIVTTVSGDILAGINVTVTEPTVNYQMYFAVKMFFDNGGGKCYINSIGAYKGSSPFHTESEYTTGINQIALEDEPTILVVPDSTKLSSGSYTNIVQALLTQCGKLGDRFALMDLFNGAASQTASDLLTNRGYFGSNHLKYGAVYYPFVKSSINYYINYDSSGLETNIIVSGAVNLDPESDSDTTDTGETIGASTVLSTLKSSNTAVYNAVKAELQNHFITLPPSGGVAGVYAAVDTARGVWKAPANVSLADVIEPVVKLDNAHQDDLNVDATTGKSINAIRAFAGKGTLVWGARTLAGNDNEWRYIPVRRFFIMVEESVKKSTYWAVFEPNDANTWVKVRGMIENYLTQKWREGALAGATTKEAFFVRCGLGTTMDSQDILEGRMNVEIGMAAVRPAEFIILKFSHKLQTS